MTYRIKPLVWREYAGGYIADTILGPLRVGRFSWGHAPAGPGGEWKDSPCHSTRQGKTRAEAYYREKLLAALEPAGESGGAK